MKCPILCLDVDFNREVLECDFDKIFFKKSEFDLLKKMKEILLEKSISKKLRKSYENYEFKEKYQWNHIIEKYYSIIIS